MRKVKLLGLAVIAVAAFSAVTVASVSAATLEWLSNGNAITTATAAVQSGTLNLEDLKAGVGVQCHGSGSGTVGPGTTDVQTVLKAENCTVLKGTCPSPSAEAVKLPWTTGLATSGANTVDPILSESGYAVTCAGIIKDTCTSVASAATVLVTKITSVVAEEFPEASNQDIATCSLGGKEGDVSGKFSVEGTAGNLISIET